MHDYQRQFIEFALEYQALKFGSFTLKSGRISPYFFNSGAFQDGRALAQLGFFYAQTIVQYDIAFDILFGPAYKGIPLVAATAIALSTHFKQNVPYCFNRKETKDHGEGGIVVGAALKGRVLLIDDVITAGTAIGECIPLIKQNQATLAAVIIALDRQERGPEQCSAVQHVQQTYHAPVQSIICCADLVEYLASSAANATHLPALRAYLDEYGVNNHDDQKRNS